MSAMENVKTNRPALKLMRREKAELTPEQEEILRQKRLDRIHRKMKRKAGKKKLNRSTAGNAALFILMGICGVFMVLPLVMIINNAVTVSPDCDKGFFEADLDYIANTVNVTSVGAMRVIKAFYPMLKKSDDTALIINISSEAGSISRCYRTNMIDYGMAKAALNMATMNLFNTFKDDDRINIFCVHPGWIRTDGKADNPAPLSSYEAAEILRKLFEDKRYDLTGPRFITNEGEAYPF